MYVVAVASRSRSHVPSPESHRPVEPATSLGRVFFRERVSEFWSARWNIPNSRQYGDVQH